MVCDKCKNKCTDNWFPGENYPKYKIEEITGIGDIAPICLCYKCSMEFKKWLDENEDAKDE